MVNTTEPKPLYLSAKSKVGSSLPLYPTLSDKRWEDHFILEKF